MDDTNQSHSSSESDTSPCPEEKESGNQTTTSSKITSVLEKTFESSLHISEKSKLYIKKKYVHKSRNCGQKDENEPEILSSPDELKSSSRKVEMPETPTTGRYKSPTDTKQNVIQNREPARKNFIPSQHQTMPSTVVKNTCTNRFFYPGPREPRSHQWQAPPPNIVEGIFKSCRTGTSHRNPTLPIRTNAAPRQFTENPLHYKNQRSSIYKNAEPTRLDQCSSKCQNLNVPDRTNEPSTSQIRPAPGTSSNASTANSHSPNETQGRINSTPDKVLKLPAKKKQKSKNKEAGNQNTSQLKPEEPKREKVTKLKELARRAHLSKMKALKIDVPDEVPPTSYIPFYGPPQGGLLLRPIQRPNIQFPTPLRSGYFESAYAAWRGILPNMQYQNIRFYPQSPFLPYSYPIFLNQSVSRPAIQSGIPIEPLSNAGSTIQFPNQIQTTSPQTGQYEQAIQSLPSAPQFQAQSMTPQRGQYQQAVQISALAPQYQNPIHPIYPYGLQYGPTLPNLTPNFQYHNPNYSVCQYQQSIYPQYRDSNHHLYQSGIPHQFNTQNPTSSFLYVNPSHATYTSPETFMPPVTQSPSTTHDSRIPFYALNPNMLPMETFTTNPASTEIIQNPTRPYGYEDQGHYLSDTNSSQHTSGMQSTVEVPSSISAGQFPPVSYETYESTNPALLDNPNQASNSYGVLESTYDPEYIRSLYPQWSISTGSTPGTPRCSPSFERNENSENP